MYTDKAHKKKARLQVPRILKQVDYSSLLFFLGILLTVAALDSAGILLRIAHVLDTMFRNKNVMVAFLGVTSSVVDNVPLTASTMGMFDVNVYPKDAPLWQLIAYCVGTGGSLLVIGSAAGVVVMGMEKMDFGWYVRKMSFPVFLGYMGGIITFILFN